MTSLDARPATDSAAAGKAYRWDLDVLRIMAILGVVAIHVIGLILGREDLRGTSTWYFGVIVDIGAIWCVPVFVMISGALLLAPAAHRDGPGAFWRKRLVRLLPAVVVWHLVYIIGVRHLLLDREIDSTVLFVQFIDARVYTALYFLSLILGLYAVAPILAAFLAGGGQRRAAGLAIAACTWTAVLVAIPGVTALLELPRGRPENALTMWLSYVGIFVAGYACRRPQATGLRWLWTGAASAALLAFGIWQFNERPDHEWLQAITPVIYYSLPTVIASVCLFLCVIDLCARVDLPERAQRVLRQLGAATFGVFVTHLLFVALFRKFATDFYLDPSPVAKTLLYLGVLGLAFVTSLIARQIPVLRRVF